MKKIHISYTILLLLFMTACNLDRFPEDKMSPNTFFTSEKELQLWTNYFYDMFDNAESLSGQNADDNIDNALGDLMMGQRLPQSESGWNWDKLRDINYYLVVHYKAINHLYFSKID